MVNNNLLLPQFFAEAKSFTDGGLLAEYAWTIVVLPFIAALAITFFGKKLPYGGAEIAVGSILFIFLIKSQLLILSMMGAFLMINSILALELCCRLLMAKHSSICLS